MPMDSTRNACELEIDLFCHGLRIAPDAVLDGARGISRTRAGLGSGLEIVLPARSWLKDEIWMNAPVVESFAAESPFLLVGDPAAGHAVIDERTSIRYPVRLPG